MTITILLCWSIHGGLRYESLLEWWTGHYWSVFGDVYLRRGGEWLTP